jgi:hypothetical protein
VVEALGAVGDMTRDGLPDEDAIQIAPVTSTSEFDMVVRVEGSKL